MQSPQKSPLRLGGKVRRLRQDARLTQAQMAEQLAISPKTVDTYKQRVNDKLGLAHRADYVKLALKLGLLQAPTV